MQSMNEEKEIEEIKALPKKIAIFFILIISLFLIGIFGFMIIEKVSFSHGILRTLESMAFIFKETSDI